MSRTPNLVRAFREYLASADRFGPEPFRSLSRSAIAAEQGVRAFYLVVTLYVWMNIFSWHNLAALDPPLERVWPIRWAEGIPTLILVDVASVATVTFSLLAFWRPHIAIFRIGFAAAFLICSSVPASTGAINHGQHELFWVAAIFVFLPRLSDRASHLSYCITFAAAQGLVMVFYSMAGFWKFFYGMISLVTGDGGNFSVGALSWTVAGRSLQTGTQPLFAPFFVEHPVLATISFYFLIYVQLVAIFIAFRPTLHIVWGAFLIAFHTGTFLLLEIPFPTHVVVLMILFVASPFQRPDWFQWKTLRLLPGFAILMTLAPKVRSPRKSGERLWPA